LNFELKEKTMAKKADRIIIYLACTECKERNYTSSKNKRNDPTRLEFNKYCRRCRTTRLHRETK
jgi:large subunit ribosomal protein L33